MAEPVGLDRAEPVAGPAERHRTMRRSLAERAAAPFGLAATVAMIFNTVLAWTKDASDAVNASMTALTGHHWITHGLADLALFLGLGTVLTLIGRPRRLSDRLTLGLVGAAIVAAGGLAFWFLLF